MRENDMLGAYFTVEAAFVMPMVIAVMVLIIFMMFYQYDRCLMEQNMGRMSVRAVVNYSLDSEQWLEVMKKNVAEIKEEDYLAWHMEEVQLQKGRGKVKVSQTGKLEFPLSGGVLEGIGPTWRTAATYESGAGNPCLTIRTYRKLKN